MLFFHQLLALGNLSWIQATVENLWEDSWSTMLSVCMETVGIIVRNNVSLSGNHALP